MFKLSYLMQFNANFIVWEMFNCHVFRYFPSWTCSIYKGSYRSWFWAVLFPFLTHTLNIPPSKRIRSTRRTSFGAMLSAALISTPGSCYQNRRLDVVHVHGWDMGKAANTRDGAYIVVRTPELCCNECSHSSCPLAARTSKKVVGANTKDQ